MASLPGATHPLRLGDYQLRVCASIPLMGETRFKIGGWSGQRDANDPACATRPALLAGSAQRGSGDLRRSVTVSLRNGGTGTLGDWSVEELAEFLKSAAISKGIAFGS